jgi:hypothetical protein
MEAPQLATCIILLSYIFTHVLFIQLSHTHITAQAIAQPPVSTTAALGTNATFSCRGTGIVLWQINGTQVRDASQVPNFETILVYVPLPRDSSSELIVTATKETNASLMIMCLVDPGIGMGDVVMSDAVQLLVYGRYLCYAAVQNLSLLDGYSSVFMCIQDVDQASPCALYMYNPCKHSKLKRKIENFPPTVSMAGFTSLNLCWNLVVGIP